MLRNYVLIAWRHILKNKLYTLINVAGLVIGLAVYIFGSLLATYEQSYDLFYKNADRIYTVGSILSPTAPIGFSEFEGVPSAMGPIIEADAPEIAAVVRTIGREYLLSVAEDSYYQSMRFADPDFTTVFDFDYLEGDDTCLRDPTGMLITRSAADKLFGEGPALHKTVTLDHNVVLQVTAVVRDLPQNTHFNTALDHEGFDIVAPMKALSRAEEFDPAGNYTGLGSGNMTYVLLPEGRSPAWLQSRLDAIYERNFPEEAKDLLVGFRIRPLPEVNTIIWDMIGLPVIETVQLLALLVLIVAIVNYTNLATAQSLGRTREVGLRKTMGAVKTQLLQQFLIESLTIAAIAMLIALAVLEVCVPLFNEAVDRALTIDYGATLPWLITTTVAVGLGAGAYPAYVITRARPIDALRDGDTKGVKGSWFRTIMLGLQFTISIFMLAMVLVVYFQNQKLEASSDDFPRSQILVLKRLGLDSIRARHETLRSEISKIAGVEHVTYSNQVQYDQSTSGTFAGTDPEDRTPGTLFMQVWIDEYFLACYDIPLLAGRNLSSERSGDLATGELLSRNVIVNELTVEILGFDSAANAIGRTLYDFPPEGPARPWTIVGVVPSLNFQSFFNPIKPMIYRMDPGQANVASIHIQGASLSDTREEIEALWDRLVPEYPIQAHLLDEDFENYYSLFSAMAQVLGGFAFLALSLSLIGLFGMAAFMVQRRTREIGIRKVMGANMMQIVRLLIWQFSRPVLWALLLALPLAYVGSGIYLDFFADRLTMPEAIILFAGLLAVICAWGIVAVHAFRIARAKPINALRYE